MTSSCQAHAAVDENFRSDYVTRLFRKQKAGKLPNFLSSTEAFQKRLGGSRFFEAMLRLGSQTELFDDGSLNGAGLSTLTRIPRGASSTARVFPKETTAAFVAE